MPDVSIVVPCLNEQETIQLLLDAIYRQTYHRQKMEVIIADGLSTDSTRERVRSFQEDHDDLPVWIIDNPKRTIPAGLNLAIGVATGEIIIRLDAHSVPQPEYVSRCVEALKIGSGDNVGGIWDIQPGGDGLQARAIAYAAAHPLGVGDARYRFTSQAQYVDTVPFGSFYTYWIDRIGGFDESLLTNEDYEFNTRMRKAGGRIWLDPSIRSVYYARSTFKELAKQYWRYGYWKARMLFRHPSSLRVRQGLPPIFVLSLVILPVLSTVWPYAGWIFMIELASYALVLLLVGLYLGVTKKDYSLVIGVPLAIAIMHITWGSAFLWSLIFR